MVGSSYPSPSYTQATSSDYVRSVSTPVYRIQSSHNIITV